jgi:hypothetical protein
MEHFSFTLLIYLSSQLIIFKSGTKLRITILSVFNAISDFTSDLIRVFVCFTRRFVDAYGD